jgi:phospholipid transport system substrate-binding protein
VIPRYFDVNEMARKSLGPHWSSLDAASRQRYLDTFGRFMVANYAGRFDGYSGQSFETLGEAPGPRDTVIVKSRLIDPTDKNVDLNYRMHKVGEGWKIVDVYLDGTVSELALRRSEFVAIVKRQNLDALLVALDAKIAKLAAGGEG